MENELIIKDEKGIVCIFRVLIPIFLIIVVNLDPDGMDRRKDILGRILVAAPFVIAWIVFELRSRFWGYYFSAEKCCYSSFIGKKREFYLNDIYKIYPKKSVSNVYVLEKEDGLIFTMIEREEKNAEKLLPFFQAQQQAGNWNGIILKELDVLDYKRWISLNGFHIEERMVRKKNNCFKEIPDTLMLKPKKEDKYDKRYLLFTTEWCEYKKDWKNTVRFHFDEIEDINRITSYGTRRNTRDYLQIVLKNRGTETLWYDGEFTNSKMIQPYVAYHRKKKYANDNSGR